jgi:hypothetical protein
LIFLVKHNYRLAVSIVLSAFQARIALSASASAFRCWMLSCILSSLAVTAIVTIALRFDDTFLVFHTVYFLSSHYNLMPVGTHCHTVPHLFLAGKIGHH